MSKEPTEKLPETCLPTWSVGDLPEPKPLRLRQWTSFIGPGIVMCGIALAGGEWLVGSEITARYGGGLMWIALVAIVCQVFYNMECGRYALYTGEPVITGMLRSKPGPRFWIGVLILLNLAAFIPGISTQGAAALAALILDRPPGAEDRVLVITLAYILLGLVSLPILIGGKIYNMMQAVMTTKVFVVLIFCGFIGVFFVSASNWGNVFSGFLKFGTVPVVQSEDFNGNGLLDPGEDFDRDGTLDVVEPILERDIYGNITRFEDLDGDGKWDGENVRNVFASLVQDGTWPTILLVQIALLGAFAGYAGGGGLSNSTYSNYVRDKGWGMGGHVGAIPSAVGGRNITLSHLGTVFRITPQNLARWKVWWKRIVTDQLFIWAPGCVMGMALPALLSIQFSPNSSLYHDKQGLDWAQAVITADGMKNTAALGSWSQPLWIATLIVGMIVLLPSQMSIVEDVCRRWTDIIWSGSRRVRERMGTHQVRRIYYTIMVVYVTWTFICATLFLFFSKPKVMVLVIANLNNLAIGLTAILVLANNIRFLPAPLRPGLLNRAGMIVCVLFYLGLTFLVFWQKQIPMIRELFGG